MAESMIITPVVEQGVVFVFGHTYQELQYIWKFKTNIQTLTNTMTSLETRREAIRLLIDAAKRNAEVIGPDVEEWMQKVELMKNEVDEILQETRNAQIGCCFNCKCPNLKVRYSLSKKAAIKTIEIGNLQGKGEFTRVGYPGPIGRRPFLSSPDFVGFESRRLVEENVMKALLDENIPIIAICGMGGVGKTTMVKKIADIIKKENHFDEVVMAVVSQNYDPINVQQQLAEKLGLEIKETTLDARADRLHTRLMDQGKRILLVIDDLWEEMKLGDIGIPTEVERKGLKVILTSRLPGICSNMHVKEIIEVGVLIEEEAWVLFKKLANISDDDSDVLEGYPKKVADKCQGLPLAIEVIGKTLKDRKQLFEWRDAYQRLNSAHDSDTSENKVYSSMKWSVDFLERQHKSLLLHCSLFPEDYEIKVEDLVRYTKGMQFLEGIETMTETRDRVGTIIRVLTDRYLLIACDDNCVKLHDVVRDTCLRIASKGENVFMVSHSILKEWPYKETYESYTAISLDFDDNLIELPSGLNCSSLQLLRLSCSWVWRRPNILNNLTSFLETTEKLRVLNIETLAIELPESLQTSMNLRTLNLHYCSLNGDLSALLERLVKVEVLSFFNSTYEGKWPKEIGKLSNLKSLDMRFRNGPSDMRFRNGPSESLPTGILIHLKKLEELYLNLKVQMCLPESHEVIKEIGSMSNLNTIWISGFNSPSLVALVENLNVERLSRFYFSPSVVRWAGYQFSRKMIVKEANMGMLLEPKMKALLSEVDESLELDGVTGFNNDFDGRSVFRRSRILKLTNCEMKYICNTTNSAQGVFVHLKRLYIKGAEHLEELCHGNIPPGSFAKLERVSLKQVPLLSCLWGPIQPPSLGNLAILKIHQSKLITSLVLWSSVKCFAQLRVLDIESCPKLETIVSCNGKIEKDTVEDMPFKKLEELYLDYLKSFKTLCSEQEAPNTVFVERMVVSLKILHLHYCPDVRLDEKSPWRMMFNQLEHLSLQDLPQFISFRRMLPKGTVAFQKLLILKIHRCNGLRYMLTPPMVRMFGSLKELEIKDCEQMGSIIGREEEDDEVATIEEETVAFQKLLILKIHRCNGLRYLLAPPMVRMFSSLKELVIEYCWEMKSIIGREEDDEVTTMEEEIGFPELCKLTLRLLPKLKMLTEVNVAFQKLLILKIDRCNGLRYLLTPSMVRMVGSLQELEILYCKQMESIIGREEDDEVATIEEELGFPELCKLTLCFLPKLKMLTEVNVAFQKLLILKIGTCIGLRYLFTPLMVRMFGSLKELVIENCRELESIIGRGEDDEVTTMEEEIGFPELCELTLCRLPRLRMICSEPVNLSLPHWNKFALYDCPRINKFCAGNLNAPMLKQVSFLEVFSDDIDFVLDLETMRNWFKDCELGKRCINCARYGKGKTCDHLTEGSSTNEDNEDDTWSSEDSEAEDSEAEDSEAEDSESEGSDEDNDYIDHE